MEIILWLVVGVLLLQLAFALWNVRQLPLLAQPQHKPGDAQAEQQPRLSILIPARNETRNIGACLTSVLEAGPANGSYEVIVLDDRSEDDTNRLAVEAIGGDPRVTLIRGEEPPAGWIGKAYACHQLAEAATGKWWLFLDADARMEKGAVEAAWHAAQKQGDGLITGFPRQLTKTWMERLVVPMMGFTIGCHLPIRLVRGSSDARFAAAHGAWMLINSGTYKAIGGHAANRNNLVDDMALAREVKRQGYAVTLADVKPVVHMRMYHDAREVWHGFRKNMYAGTGRNPVLLAAVLGLYSCLYLLPFLALLLSPIITDWLVPAAAAYLLGVAIKCTTDRMQDQPGWLAWLLPASIACMVAIGVASWLSAGRGKGYEWKGRIYQ
ncbi:glycosyltransferase [Paenibacillus daejeonensis]|uniref:glycosyltransferase n=1 Tax=Paenibacillus daejeonensis TaxID=135193 RepID=UPI00037871F5|nr:glycosyltransferase family 2 protein [Paenibacillus daejeonensis]